MKDDILIYYKGPGGFCIIRIESKDFISLRQEFACWCVRYYDVWRQTVIQPIREGWIKYDGQRYPYGEFGKLSMQIESDRLENTLEAL